MLTLVTDRKQSDVDRAKELIEKAKKIEDLSSSELNEYLNGLKGCYTITDLNRVENAVKYVSDWLNKDGYYNSVNIRIWKDGDFLNTSQINRYLNNIRTLRNAISVPSSTPAVPGSYKPFENANDIERIIRMIERVLMIVESNYVYSSVAMCGQNRIWQQRFRRYGRSLKQWLELTQVYWSDFSEIETWEDIIYD